MTKRTLVSALMGLTLALVPATSQGSPAVLSHSCSSGWKHAVIRDAHKCLRRGQFCSKQYDRQYHRYGFHCHGRRLT